jgi:hypothetical protein
MRSISTRSATSPWVVESAKNPADVRAALGIACVGGERHRLACVRECLYLLNR